jgi:hypothetical protein
VLVDLESDARRLPSWGFVLAVLLVLVVVAVWVDGRTRSRENLAIDQCRQGLRIATDDAEGRLGLVSHYLQPPLTTDGRVQRLHLADLMAARAGQVLPGIQQASRACRRITVEPWHFSQVARHNAATAYAAALVTLVQTITAQGPTRFPDDRDLERLQAAAGVG